MLVFATDLEQVEEVGCRCVDGNEVFVRFWGGGGEVEDFEVFGALGTSVQLFVHLNGPKYTLTYSLISMPFILWLYSKDRPKSSVMESN